MKRLFSLVMVLVTVLGLLGCTGETSPETQTAEPAQPEAPLLVGFGRESITPKTSVPLDGYGNGGNRKSTNVLDELYVTCIAISQGEDTVLLMTQDLLHGYSEPTLEARMRVMMELKVGGNRVMISATHTHAAPSLGTGSDAAILAYRELYYEAVLSAAQKALDDRAEAEIYGTTVQTEGINFVRHYLRADGTYTGSGFGAQSSAEIVSHVAEGDHSMQLVKFQRQGDKQDILLMNWQAHPTYNSGSAKTDISADYIGTVRDKIETDTDLLFAFFQGAAGDMVYTSKMEEKAHNYTVEQYGDVLGQYAIDALDSMTKIEGGGIQSSQQIYTYAYNHDGEDKLTQAKEVAQQFNANGVLAEGNKLAWSYGFSSVYEAVAITKRVKREATGIMELNVIRVGELAFVVAPYEMFSGSGMYIKENSPFEMTFLLTCANQPNGYFATKEAYDYGCYESVTSIFARGCAEDTAAKFVEMLKGIE